MNDVNVTTADALAARLREATAKVEALELENSQLLTWGTDWSVGNVRVWRLRPGQYGVRRRGDYLHGMYDSAGEAIAAARALAAKEGS